MVYYFIEADRRHRIQILILAAIFLITFFGVMLPSNAQIVKAQRSGFTWISTENVEDKNYGSGYTMYSAAWPAFKKYPGPNDFQTGLSSSWMTTQRTGNEPNQFYTTIEGGLGWWHDTRFGTKIPKFIMGGVSYNFFAWANGPGAGRSNLLPNGQRDWSTPGGKYGVAQLSNKLLWAPDGLNMAQSLNGEMLGYGYIPLPLTDPIPNTNGTNIRTGNQCWTLFLNSTNFRGPATFFLPTFWTEPALQNPALEGLFLDTRPSEPNVGFGVEHAGSPALISRESNGQTFAKVEKLLFPISDEDNSFILNQISVYSKNALWDEMETWFNGGPAVLPGIKEAGTQAVSFTNNGGAMAAEISESSSNGIKHDIDLNYIDNVQQNTNLMGFKYDLNIVEKDENNFLLPEYFRLDPDNKWRAITKKDVPSSSKLITTEVPRSPRPELTYLTPLESDCHWQDPNGPWNKPGPITGPFTADLGDGTTVTYYWYRFVDQPSIIHANLPEIVRTKLQNSVELLHSSWSHTDEYLTPPSIGKVATLDPAVIVKPPAGLEIGYVPIVTRQEKSKPRVRVFVLAGQSNMEGYGTIDDAENDPGSLHDVIQNDVQGSWSQIGEKDNWTILDNAFLYFERNGETIKSKVTVGQGAYAGLIGPELMFAHQLDEFYEDPILIIKTAWGGKSLAEDFRPPSAAGATGAYYDEMIEIVRDVTGNLANEFPEFTSMDYEISGFGWFQGWNDGASDDFLNEYENNLYYLVNDIRKDLNIPDLPVVISSSGQGGYEQIDDLWVQSMQNIVSLAQKVVGCNDTLYGGKVGFVNTKPFYIHQSSSPEDAIYHFNNNALTFLNIGKSMGDEMILAINDMAFCYEDCSEPVSPGIVSIGNRIWNDLDQDGLQDPDEPGIPGVSLVIWSDSDGDDIPDWQGFGGVRVTDEDGYYSFTGLQPGNYVVFVWSVNNWGPGEPLANFKSTNGFQADANNDVDFDNNGSGNPFTDIMSGIVTLRSDEEPLNDGDPVNCYFDYDASGNNTVDFGFYNPDVSAVSGEIINDDWIQIFPIPVQNIFTIQGKKGVFHIELYDSFGRMLRKIDANESFHTIDISSFPTGLYFVKTIHKTNNFIKMQKIIKHQ
ncbi:MAG: T9SS type A sorting domain-containing protein [Saprospiraceae bacterium]|nr:T9SS type A sorting domain-containing protein [Saprospiraceae bacterium]